MQTCTLFLEDVLKLAEAMRDNQSHAEIDWVNRTIRVLSERKPTYKKDGTRLHLSSGPAFHREVLFEISYKEKRELPFEMQDLHDKR